MIIYQLFIDSTDRVIWHGGESTQLHYQMRRNNQWKDFAVRTLGGGFPGGMSEFHAEMRDYYDYCNTMELERRLEYAC